MLARPAFAYAGKQGPRQVSLSDEDSSYRTGCFRLTANAREAAAAALRALEERIGAAPRPSSWLTAAAEEPAR